MACLRRAEMRRCRDPLPAAWAEPRALALCGMVHDQRACEQLIVEPLEFRRRAVSKPSGITPLSFEVGAGITAPGGRLVFAVLPTIRADDLRPRRGAS